MPLTPRNATSHAGLSRRGFLAAGITAASAPRLSPGAEVRAGWHREEAREIPLRDDVDVIVCGAGPAGVAAAIAAARNGARTRLFEAHGCLGGIWTSGLLCWILDHGNKLGFMAELLRTLDARGARGHSKSGRPSNAYDPEAMKLLLEELCAGAGVNIQFHTRVCAAVRDNGGRLSRIITESKSGREAFAARCFVDCTGDGDVGALAGCTFDLGHPDTGLLQPMSLMALVAGLDTGEIEQF